ncbi:DUF3750 domain-containing protein [Methylobrevis albus]|uniref:DUF3750 domain-containing protein n=1 Tax=Methylobrevis albus TaxID=2793297 RepID=A0A931MYZ4_9HYPH|nr:DUF3750 domain-containing protein [Methylobrevis albus]MBH0237474.1 DUF3750 domain-containing protein [Methylobrevis albus]
MRRLILLVLLVCFTLPLASHALWRWTSGWPGSWSGADWSSAGLLPAEMVEDEAVVHVMAARVGNWRSIFAHHSWVVLKRAGAETYTRYDVVGWGEPVRTNHRVADGRWYGNEPEILLTLTGAAAEAAVPVIEQAVRDYPYPARGSYRAWPGPNSNTFIAHLAAEVPVLAPALLPTAIGKDFRDGWFYAGTSVSGTGLQLSLGGVFGVTVGWVEGAELNLLGLVAGVDLRRPALKLPGWGRLGMAPA